MEEDGTAAQAGPRHYNFPTDDAGYNYALAEQFEAVGYAFSEFLHVNRHLRTVFADNEEFYSVRGGNSCVAFCWDGSGCARGAGTAFFAGRTV